MSKDTAPDYEIARRVQLEQEGLPYGKRPEGYVRRGPPEVDLLHPLPRGVEPEPFVVSYRNEDPRSTITSEETPSSGTHQKNSISD